MLSIVLGAVALAGVIVVAAQARERRALAADVRSLRLELKRACEALAARRADLSPRSRACIGPGPGTDRAAPGHDDAADDERGPRTLH